MAFAKYGLVALSLLLAGPVSMASPVPRPAPLPFASLDLQGKGANSLRPKSLVVWVHGYGSNGSDFVAPSASLGRDLPDTVFLYPDAPTAMQGRGDRPSFTWYEFAGGDAAATRQAAMAYLLAKIDTVQAAYDIPDERVLIAGFSQGGGTAIQTLTCSGRDFGAGVSIAGVVDTVCALPEDDETVPDILMIYNDGDPMVPLDWGQRSKGLLEEDGFAPIFRVFDADRHWPDADGMKAVSAFIVEQLGQ